MLTPSPSSASSSSSAQRPPRPELGGAVGRGPAAAVLERPAGDGRARRPHLQRDLRKLRRESALRAGIRRPDGAQRRRGRPGVPPELHLHGGESQRRLPVWDGEARSEHQHLFGLHG